MNAYREFKVVFDGVELTDDTVARIDEAIQDAVKQELARSQIATSSVRPLREQLGEQELSIGGGGHQTDGMYVQ